MSISLRALCRVRVPFTVRESAYSWVSAAVRSLDIAGTGIVGSLPSEFGNLVHLTQFEAYQVGLSGTLPSTISGLSSLMCASREDLHDVW